MFMIALIASLILGAVIIFGVKLLLITKTPRELAKDSKNLIQETKKTGSNIYKNLLRTDNQKLQDIDDELFTIANKEVEASLQNEGMWVKSLILAEGDESKQKTEYIKLRVRQLSKKESDELL